VRSLAAVTALLLSLSSAFAAGYECAQVRLIVPYPAGGATDVAARVVGERLEAALKRPVIIETRAGATGNIGTVAVIQAKPDGCTLLVNAAVIATFPHSFSKLNYDPIKDLAPIGGIGVTPTMLVTASANPPNDVKGLVAWSKSKPDGLTFATAGYGLLQHLAVEEIAQREGAKFVHAAYRGGAQAVTDLITARLDFGSFAAGSVLPLVREGKLKAIAVIQDKRSGLAPGRCNASRTRPAESGCGRPLHAVRAGGDAEGYCRDAEQRVAQDHWRRGPEGALRRHRFRSDADLGS
jgi:tripartite-type tricarboxylate transporter receptor subunit TctC